MDIENQLHLAETFAYLLDGRFQLWGVRIGLLSFLDLIPEIGDILSFLPSFYLIYIAFNLKVPWYKIGMMIGNILINLFVGLIPIVGDVAYIFHKANLRNLQILRGHTQIIQGEVISE